MTTITSVVPTGPEGGPGWRTEHERAYALRSVRRGAGPVSPPAASAAAAAVARAVEAVRRWRWQVVERLPLDLDRIAAKERGPAPVVPSRDCLVRDGIPAEVMAHFRERATTLRAEAIAASVRGLVGSLRRD